ncbi:sensor histidine kinase [Urechidicola vernalis]|uniref:histidine kinase n=1 Tax=Urechidicola vernalis TaxID=3075600 RepID=A0ABU2Y5A4_9FLAO|nr:ATP-binding protein [Urechidicola sp. P050]MDT0552839.1 ATP-binding protein [Urechidicola sp. P050]
MKNFFKKVFAVALIFINATLVFGQDSFSLDKVFSKVDRVIMADNYDLAEFLLDSLTNTPEYKGNIKLKIDLERARLDAVQNKTKEALSILLDGLTIAQQNAYNPYIIPFSYEIASGFSLIENYDNAFKYFRITLEYAEIQNDSLGKSMGYIGLGGQHFRLYREKKLDSIHEDSLNYYYNNTIKLFPKKYTDKTILRQVYTNLMSYCYYSKEFDKADIYGNKSLLLLKNLEDSIKAQNTFNTLGAINIGKKDYKKAIEYYSISYNLVKDRKDIVSATAMGRSFGNISDAYARMDSFKKAYEYRLLSIGIKDSLAEVTDKRGYALVAGQYNYTEKERLAIEEKNRRQRTELWLYIISISSVLVLSLLFMVYRSRRLKREKQLLVLEQETLVKESALEKIQNEAQIKILNATIDGKETERRHIAEILHNSVSALLSSAGLHLQAAKLTLKEQAPEEIAKTQDIVSEAGEKIRDLSHTLISSVLLKFGLAFAMDDLCEKYSNSKITFKAESNNIKRFESEFEIKMHSIIEELINNILKHSNASYANILLKQYDGKLEVRIFDNGTGFDVAQMKKKKKVGLGLTQIEARIKMMNGVFDIKSSEETGTRIYINVPVPVKKA